MTAFVKPLMLSVFAAGALALSGGAQPPEPPAAPQVPPVPGVAGRPGMPARVFSYPQGEGFLGGEGMFAPADFNVSGVRSLGNDPRTRELAKKLAEAKDDDAKAKLRDELKAALAKAFDDRLKGQEKQVADLEAQLKRLKEMVSKRREAKADIVTDRLASLEKEAKGLGW